jgi:cyclopropane-fatty-acyl-phospholipid synthase
LSGAPGRGPYRRCPHERRLFFNPALALGEAYMDGSLVMERGTIYDFLVCFSQSRLCPLATLARSVETFRFTGRWLRQFNPQPRASATSSTITTSTAASRALPRRDRQYSCAYFEQESMSLESPSRQEAPPRAKLNLRDGMRVLDIGPGWGGLGLYPRQIRPMST